MRIGLHLTTRDIIKIFQEEIGYLPSVEAAEAFKEKFWSQLEETITVAANTALNDEVYGLRRFMDGYKEPP